MKKCTPSLAVNIAGIKMKNPVMCASGTFGFGEEFSEFIDLNTLGALVTKTITLEPREGNPSPRTIETPCGMLNSIGLQNPGVKAFISDKMPFLRKLRIPVIVSIAGRSRAEYARISEILSGISGIAGIEVNISCPNVKFPENKLMFSQDPAAARQIVKAVRRKIKLPMIVKLSPNVTDIRDFAGIAEDEGADALSLINTPIGMAVDVEKRRPCLKAVRGGLSGPAIKPIALRMVWDVFNVVKIPIIGVGGIMDFRDALEFVICGAKAVQIGTANFVDPRRIPEVVKDMKRYLEKKNIRNINSLTGSLNTD